MKRISLCPRSGVIGFLFVGVMFLGLAIATGIDSKNVWGFVAVVAIPSILGFPLYWSLLSSRGKFLEYDDEKISLISDREVVWRLSWEDLLAIDCRKPFFNIFVDRDGKEFPFPSAHMDRRDLLGLRFRLPADGYLQIRPTRQKSARVAWIFVIAGTLLISEGIWSCMAFASLSRQNGQTGDASLESRLQSWPLGLQFTVACVGACFLGVGLVWLSRRPLPEDGRLAATKVEAGRSLLGRILAGNHSPKFAAVQTFVGHPDIMKRIRAEQGVGAAGILVFGTIATACALAVNGTKGGDSPLMGLCFLPFVALGFASLWFSALEWKTRTWTVKIDRESITAISPDGQVFDVQLSHVLWQPYLWILGAGRKLSIDPRHFVLK